jgi:hypothetical protein
MLCTTKITENKSLQLQLLLAMMTSTVQRLYAARLRARVFVPNSQSSLTT